MVLSYGVGQCANARSAGQQNRRWMAACMVLEVVAFSLFMPDPCCAWDEVVEVSSRGEPLQCCRTVCRNSGGWPAMFHSGSASLVELPGSAHAAC